MDRTALIEVLGVSPDPTTAEVRRARRTVARRLHPDARRGAGTLMAEVNAACDQWLTEIRVRRDRPAPTARPTSSSSPTNVVQSASPPRRTAIELRLVVAACALASVVFFTGLSATVLGPSARSLAAGFLVGSGAAGILVVASMFHRERRAGRPSGQ